MPPTVLDREECKSLARLEEKAVERFAGCPLKNLVNRDGYSLSVEDLLASLPRLPLDRWDEEKLCDWGTFFSDILEGQTDPDKGQFYTEKDALLYMLDGIYQCRLGFNGERIPDALEVGRLFLADRDKPVLERRYPTKVKEELLHSLEDDTAMKGASEERIALYRRFATELAEEGNKTGLHALGYSCYGGNRAFECDWEKARAKSLFYYTATFDGGRLLSVQKRGGVKYRAE